MLMLQLSRGGLLLDIWNCVTVIELVVADSVGGGVVKEGARSLY